MVFVIWIKHLSGNQTKQSTQHKISYVFEMHIQINISGNLMHFFQDLNPRWPVQSRAKTSGKKKKKQEKKQNFSQICSARFQTCAWK